MPALAIRPLTPARWPDLEAVFLAKGCSVARGCWCMYYRETGPFILAGGKAPALARKRKLQDLAREGPPPGLLAYLGRKPVGWVTLGPRAVFRRLEKSRAMKAVDGEPVWSLVCFVVPSEFRGQGVASALLRGAIDYAAKQGASILEAYPKEPDGHAPDDSMWFGTRSMYDKAGFDEVARHEPGRPVMRINLGARRKGRGRSP